MLKINMLRMALMNQAQTVSGMRGRVMPLARRSSVVTMKLSEVSSAAKQKSATLAVQIVKPALGSNKKGGGDAGEGGRRGPKGKQIQHREGHFASANLQRQEIVAEAGLRRGSEHQEDHQRAMEQVRAA